MINGMTGFGKARSFISRWGRVNVEVRSVNHRFLDIVLHLPEGCLHLEQKLKDEIGKRIKRGHVICRLEVNTPQFKRPVLNKHLMKEYYLVLKQISKQFNLKQELNINTLASLPGIWSVQSQVPLSLSWAQIQPLAKEALDSLIQRRQQEGKATYNDLIARAGRLATILKVIKARFKKVIKQKIRLYNNEEEQNSFLRSSDINEEIVRLGFHLKSFTRCLKDTRVMGKELDFILQEMQREANTTGAKSVDAVISGRVIAMKSEIEKMREHVQNVE